MLNLQVATGVLAFWRGSQTLTYLLVLTLYHILVHHTSGLLLLYLHPLDYFYPQAVLVAALLDLCSCQISMIQLYLSLRLTLVVDVLPSSVLRYYRYFWLKGGIYSPQQSFALLNLVLYPLVCATKMSLIRRS